MAKKLTGLRGFIFIWVGQVFSMIGSQMTHFAMGIWAWEKTGQATSLALVGFFSFAPLIIFTPIAGVLVDRWNRKLVMALSDIGAGIVTFMASFYYRCCWWNFRRFPVASLFRCDLLAGTKETLHPYKRDDLNG